MPRPKVLRFLLLFLFGNAFITPLSTLKAIAPVTDFAITPDGMSLVCISQEGIDVRPLPQTMDAGSSPSSSAVVRRQKVPTANLHSIAFSPDGTKLLVCGGRPSETSFLGVYSWPMLLPLESSTIEGDSFLSGLWLNDNLVATGGLDSIIRIWKTNTLQLIKELNGHSKAITSMTTLPGSKLLISGGLDNSVRVWSLEDYSLQRSLKQHIQPVQALASLSLDEGLPIVASASDDRTVRFWQPTIGRMVRFIRLPSKPQAITWIGNERLAAACSNGHVYFVDTVNVSLLDTRAIPTGWCYAISLTPDSSRVYISGSMGTVVALKAPETTSVDGEMNP